MSNQAKITLEELEVDETNVADALKCLLHTIVFHRCLGEITPSDFECEHIPELHYPTADIEKVNTMIEEKVKLFIESLSYVPSNIKSNSKQKNSFVAQLFTIELIFYSTKTVSGFLTTREESIDWEKWSIPLKILFTVDHRQVVSATGTSDATSKATINATRKRNSLQKQNIIKLVESLEQRMKQILKEAHEKTEHLPPVKKDDTLKYFPFKIILPDIAKSSISTKILDYVWPMKS